nr:MAG TPA: hypothetical protein [Caudoviricetes sp.]
MLGWIIIAILCVIAVLCVTRCSPILFGLIMGVAVAYIGGYSLLALMTFLLGLLVWWILNEINRAELSINNKLNIMKSSDPNAVIASIGSASILINYFAWPFEIGFISSIIVCKSILPTYMDYMAWYRAQVFAGGIFLILLGNTIVMYLIIAICKLRNHHST